MRKVEIELYKFDELSDEAKGKVIDDFSDINTEFEWWESVYFDAEEIGLKITEFDMWRSRIAGDLTIPASDVAERILENHGKETRTYKIAQKYRQNPTEYGAGSFLYDLLHEYLSILQKEWDYQTSEEAIIETIKANEYEFFANGRQY